MDNMNRLTETYGARYKRTMTWIAAHVAQDLMLLHGRDSLVTPADEAKLQDMERRDAAVATFPPESNRLV